MSTWTVEYRNSECGDYSREWYDITNGTRTFEAESKEDADWLCALLNGKTENGS